MTTRRLKAALCGAVAISGLSACTHQAAPIAAEPPSAARDLQSQAPAAAALPSGSRQVMFTGNLNEIQQLIPRLPQSFSQADGARVLIRIDPSKIVTQPAGFHTQDLTSALSGLLFGAADWLSGNNINNLSYYPQGAYNFPYYQSSYGTYFPYTYDTTYGAWNTPYGSILGGPSAFAYPYTYNTYPFLYNYGASYYPYAYGCRDRGRDRY